MVLPLMAGCTSDFTPRSMVTGPEVLAIQVEPPEAAPGQTVTWRALIASPPGETAALGYSFVQCTPTEGGCAELEAALTLAEGDEALAQQIYAAMALRFGEVTLEGAATVIEGANMLAPPNALQDGQESATATTTLALCDLEACEEEDLDGSEHRWPRCPGRRARPGRRGAHLGHGRPQHRP